MGKGGMGGRHAATTQGFSGEGCDALAVAHPRESASSYLFSQSLAASRCNLHATSRPSHSRRSLPCHFLLCRFVLFCLVLRRRRLPVPCSRGFFRLSAQLRPPRGVSWSCCCSGPLSLRTLVPLRMTPALGSPSDASCHLTTGFPLVRPPRGHLLRLPSARLYVRYVRCGSPSMPRTGMWRCLLSPALPVRLLLSPSPRV